MVDRREMLFGGGAGLLALPGSTRRETAKLVALRSVASLAELRAASPDVGTILYEGAAFRWFFGDYSQAPLGPADNRTVVQQAGTPLNVGAWIRLSGAISATAFGATPGAGTDAVANARAFKNAIAAAGASGLPLALEGAKYFIDASSGVNFAHAGLRIVGGGGVLQFIGRGRGFVIDQGGSDGSFIEDMLVEDITIVGGPDITDGFYSRGIVRSAFRNIEVRTVSEKAFHLRHAVSNHYDGLRYSPPSTATVTAKHGIYADSNGLGFYSANCVFTNAVMEDFPGIGCQLADASGMLFSGGTFEGCDTGLIISPSSDDNLFIKLWTEENRTADVIVSGNGNGFIGNKFISIGQVPNVRIQDDAHGTWFNGGGYIRSVYVTAGARGTSFLQVGVDENRNGTTGFRGTGSFTRIECTKIDAKNTVVGRYDDILGPVAEIGSGGRWTPAFRVGRGAVALRPDLTQATYHKVGNLVFAQCFLYVMRAEGAGGDLFIDGLPFTPTARQPGSIHATQLRSPVSGALQVRADPGTRALHVSLLSDGYARTCAEHVRADTTLSISLTYLTSD